mmetsp:Transcript_20631/g.25515  ORF Transcript_20631/g.25515 Transcript_20631/m.25515 type:complete len:200 (-) Transcript_20631:424-1023(-)|eukprot:CAMPEP_0172497482 /NCGR_PEP_ID=MMETSP1066-20121228/100593_1 /TAXON_ID=671091 /ORGANISM="Coscinodiscus wailesii, Strain CCMP2513" /LENGTH=199 /DNA_ID=CAMNT_0013270291 /DNA_START=117 /DNA_END=716 /DNA_ORIENTATION=+
MFLPKSQAEKSKEAADKAKKKKATEQVENWSKEAIPPKIRGGVQINVQEVQCGDPDCAPIDTAIAIMFPSGGRGMMGIPMEVQEVTREDLLEGFPTEDVLTKWYKGEEADWPPMDDDDEEDWFDDEQQRPVLRFEVGTKVECRIGPHPVEGWAAGEVIQLWYREPTWPRDSWAPYKVQLADGRNIYAPGDIDQIIRKRK